MSVIWKYADVDGDRLAVFTADIPGEGYGINIKTDPSGCSVPLNQIQPMLLAISRWASEIGSDDRDDAEREEAQRNSARQRWIGKLLELAEADGAVMGATGEAGEAVRRPGCATAGYRGVRQLPGGLRAPVAGGCPVRPDTDARRHPAGQR